MLGPSFIKNYVKPITETILRDAPTNPLIQGLYAGAPMDPADKEVFIRDYVAKPNTPFQYDKNLQEIYTASLTDYLTLRTRLSGSPAETQALFTPDQNNQFSAEAQKAIYSIAYRFTNNVEQHQINQELAQQQLAGKIPPAQVEKVKKDAEEGRAMLLEDTKGKHIIVTEDELRRAEDNLDAQQALTQKVQDAKPVNPLPQENEDIPDLVHHPMTSKKQAKSKKEDKKQSPQAQSPKDLRVELERKRALKIFIKEVEQNGLVITSQAKYNPATGRITAEVRDRAGNSMVISTNTKSTTRAYIVQLTTPELRGKTFQMVPHEMTKFVDYTAPQIYQQKLLQKQQEEADQIEEGQTLIKTRLTKPKTPPASNLGATPTPPPAAKSPVPTPPVTSQVKVQRKPKQATVLPQGTKLRQRPKAKPPQSAKAKGQTSTNPAPKNLAQKVKDAKIKGPGQQTSSPRAAKQRLAQKKRYQDGNTDLSQQNQKQPTATRGPQVPPQIPTLPLSTKGKKANNMVSRLLVGAGGVAGAGSGFYFFLYS